MPGFIDGKTIRENKGQVNVDAYVLTGSAFSSPYIPAYLTISADGTYLATPASVSALTTPIMARPGRWGICQSSVASTETANICVAGATRLKSGNAVTSGAYVVGISLTGSTTLSATVASLVAGSVIGLGLYSSALFSSGGMIIW